MSKRREYDDDDGRRVADMSSVERPNLLTVRRPAVEREAASGEEESAPKKPAAKDASGSPHLRRSAPQVGA